MKNEDVAKAFVAGKSASLGNARTDGVVYTLHGNIICIRGTDAKFVFRWCGWYTSTTARHMNHILRALDADIRVSYKQHKESNTQEFVV